MYIKQKQPHQMVRLSLRRWLAPHNLNCSAGKPLSTIIISDTVILSITREDFVYSFAKELRYI